MIFLNDSIIFMGKNKQQTATGVLVIITMSTIHCLHSCTDYTHKPLLERSIPTPLGPGPAKKLKSSGMRAVCPPMFLSPITCHAIFLFAIDHFFISNLRVVGSSLLQTLKNSWQCQLGMFTLYLMT